MISILLLSILLLNGQLLNFFVDGVLIAVRAKLLKLHAAGRVATVLLGGVARDPIGTLVGVSAALGAFECNYETDAFCHDV